MLEGKQDALNNLLSCHCPACACPSTSPSPLTPFLQCFSASPHSLPTFLPRATPLGINMRLSLPVIAKSSHLSYASLLSTSTCILLFCHSLTSRSKASRRRVERREERKWRTEDAAENLVIEGPLPSVEARGTSSHTYTAVRFPFLIQDKQSKEETGSQ